MIKRDYIVCLCTFLSIWLPVQAELETFTNEAGQSLRAELIELSSDQMTVKLKTESGVTMNADLKAFSLSDQKRIKKWWQGIQAEKAILSAKDRIEISAKLNRKSSSNEYDNYYYIDDETKAFFPEIVIQNSELQTFKGNEVRLVVVAKDLSSSDQKLIVSATTLKSDFYDRGQTQLAGKPFRLRIYEYNSGYSTYEYKRGYEYEGYVVLIKNSKGEITHTRASRSVYLENIEALYKCKAGQMYTEDLQHKLSSTPNSYYFIK